MYSIVIPTYNEKDNIRNLLDDIQQHMTDIRLRRLIFVDDNSPDGTAEYVKQQSLPNTDVLCIHRIARSGLSTAVVEGMMLADTDYIVVMDADGQHRAEDLKKMCHEMHAQDCDLVIGSRFLSLSKLENHTGIRHKISALGNQAAKKIIKREITDALTGFFIIKRALFLSIVPQIQSEGFKILFDILFQLRNKPVKVHELQITFGSREKGESKLDAGVILDFSDQIMQMLTKNLIPSKFTLFCFVGFIGVFVNYFVLTAALFLFNCSFFASQTLSTVCSMVTNYDLNNRLSFRRNRKKGKSYFTGLLNFTLACSIGMVANIGMANFMFSMDRAWWLSSLVGIGVGTVFNFTLAKYIVWRA